MTTEELRQSFLTDRLMQPDDIRLVYTHYDRVILGGAWYVARTELRPFLEQHLSQKLDRRVTIGSLDVTWNDPLRVEMTDLHLANASWGSTPDMGTVKSVSAVIDA